MAAQQRASVASAAAGSWLGLRLQLMAAVLAAAVAVAAVAEHAGVLPWANLGAAAHGGGAHSGGSMAAGLVGLSLSYVLPISGLLSGLLSASAETEQEMVAAERVFQYLQLGSSSSSSRRDSKTGSAEDNRTHGAGAAARRQKQPAAAGSSSGACSDLEAQWAPLLPPPAQPVSGASGGWLTAGHVRFEDVWLRYDPWSPSSSRGSSLGTAPAAAGLANGDSGSSSGSSPWVLRGVTLDIEPGESRLCTASCCCGKRLLAAALLSPLLPPLCRQPRGRLRPHRRRQEQPAGCAAAAHPHCSWQDHN